MKGVQHQPYQQTVCLNLVLTNERQSVDTKEASLMPKMSEIIRMRILFFSTARTSEETTFRDTEGFCLALDVQNNQDENKDRLLQWLIITFCFNLEII